MLLILLIVFAAALGAYLYYFAPEIPSGVRSPRVAEEGDTVEIAYTGWFENNRVFDTSSASVMNDNATFPKSLSFQWRSNPTNFTFKIGSGTAIKGFDEGVRGMKIGETKMITVSPEKGYGLSNQSLIQVRQLLQYFPVILTMNTTQFSSYYGSWPLDQSAVTDPVMGWTATVTVVNNVVTVVNSPYIGQTLTPYNKWKASVVSIDDGANNGEGLIGVQHLLTPEDAGNIIVTDPSGTFIVTEVDLEAGTYTADFNREVVGKILIFQVTLVKLTKA